MRLLVCLAECAGQVVSVDDLLDQVWADVTVAPDSVYQAVTSLRRVLGDDAKQPAYIETLPRLGYRMVAAVSPWEDQPIARHGLSDASDNKPLNLVTTAESAAPAQTVTPRFRVAFVWAAGAALCLALVFALLFYGKFAKGNLSPPPAVVPQPQKSIAVLPFLDLTAKMNEEPFADGMTEELIDKLSKIPGLRVPPPTSSFYFKGRLWPRSKGTAQVTIADIAKQLGVSYVLDGSVRKSNARIRVDARLIRAGNGYVIWSETYDRPFDDILMVQDDIAGEVTKALRTAVESGSDR